MYIPKVLDWYFILFPVLHGIPLHATSFLIKNILIIFIGKKELTVLLASSASGKNSSSSEIKILLVCYSLSTIFFTILYSKFMLEIVFV